MTLKALICEYGIGSNLDFIANQIYNARFVDYMDQAPNNMLWNTVYKIAEESNVNLPKLNKLRQKYTNTKRVLA